MPPISKCFHQNLYYACCSCFVKFGHIKSHFHFFSPPPLLCKSTSYTFKIFSSLFSFVSEPIFPWLSKVWKTWKIWKSQGKTIGSGKTWKTWKSQGILLKEPKKENDTYLRNTRYTGLQTHTERRISYRSYKYVFTHYQLLCIIASARGITSSPQTHNLGFTSRQSSCVSEGNNIAYARDSGNISS